MPAVLSCKERPAAVWLLSVLVFAGCATASTPAPVTPAAADECVLIPQPSEPIDTLRVALQHEVRRPGHAGPDNDSERVVYRHLYETLIRVDCEGRLFPALAEAWNSEDGGRRWRFRLGSDARLWDGGPVTADRVVASWSSPTARRQGIEPDAIYTPNSRELVVPLRRNHRTIPLVFASLDLAVMGDPGANGWPAGTGPYRIAVVDSNMTIVLTAAQPARGLQHPPIRLELVGDDDLRDVIDAGYDLLVTDDVRALDYARVQPQYLVVPLPWDRTYVIVSPRSVRSPGMGPEEAQPPRPPRRTLEEMAQDVVRAAARASEPPYWWSDLGSCDAATFGPLQAQPRRLVAPSGLQRIVYAAGDPAGRDLAERLVALGSSSNDVELLASLGIGSELAAAISRGESRLLAAGLDLERYDRAIESGADLAYVIGLPRTVAAPCEAAAELLEAMPWLASGGDAIGAASGSLTVSIDPLVDTRKEAIARRGRVGIWIGWDGIPLLYRP